jgi:sulfur-oxidizing protein SoxY
MTTTTNQFSRRAILQGTALAALIGVGHLPFGVAPAHAALDKYPEDAFKQKGDADAIKALYGKAAEPSDKVKLDAPEIAENGAVVPVAVASKIPNTQSISILSEKNPFPLAASFNLSKGSDAYVSTRLKLGETSNVRAVIKADGKFYTAAKEVKVTIGGCG